MKRRGRLWWWGWGLIIFIMILWAITVIVCTRRDRQEAVRKYEEKVGSLQAYRVYKNKYNAYLPSEDFKVIRFERELKRLMTEREKLWKIQRRER